MENILVLSIDVKTGKAQAVWDGEGETYDSLEETRELLQALFEDLPFNDKEDLFE